MSIVLLVEGGTERALTDKIKEFLDQRAEAHGLPRIALQTRKIKSINPDALGRQIELQLQTPGITAVVGLIDVFPKFRNAGEAKNFLRRTANKAGVTQGFYAHAAQYDVEAWLLPYWEDICRHVGVKQGSPSGNPEQVNDIRPPSYHLKDLYQRAKPPHKYVKTTEMPAILKNKDLTISANACPELKSLLNTLLTLSDLPLLP